jgi:hypothetical protein
MFVYIPGSLPLPCDPSLTSAWNTTANMSVPERSGAHHSICNRFERTHDCMRDIEYGSISLQRRYGNKQTRSPLAARYSLLQGTLALELVDHCAMYFYRHCMCIACRHSRAHCAFYHLPYALQNVSPARQNTMPNASKVIPSSSNLQHLQDVRVDLILLQHLTINSLCARDLAQADALWRIAQALERLAHIPLS